MLLAALIAAAALPQAHGPPRYDPRLDCRKGYTALVRAMRQRPGLTERASGSGALDAYLSPRERAIYTLTRKGHAAHPAIVRQSLNATDGGAVIHMLGCGYGPRAPLDRFMRNFASKNRELREAMELGATPFDAP